MNPKESTEPMSIDYTPGPLLDAARNTPTALWNDSADPDELRQSISFGGVGATCNPTIAYTCINQRKDVWLPRIAELAEEMPEATESEIGWQVVREMSIEAATLLEQRGGLDAHLAHDLPADLGLGGLGHLLGQLGDAGEPHVLALVDAGVGDGGVAGGADAAEGDGLAQLVGVG